MDVGLVWDKVAHGLFLPRSKRDTDRFQPLHLRRSEALAMLEHTWEKFLHLGEVLGPSERVGNGSSPGRGDMSVSDLGCVRVAARTVRGGANLAVVKPHRHWLVGPGRGWDLVDARDVSPHET